MGLRPEQADAPCLAGGEPAVCRAEEITRASSRPSPSKDAPAERHRPGVREQPSWAGSCSAADTTCVFLTGRQLSPTCCSSGNGMTSTGRIGLCGVQDTTGQRLTAPSSPPARPLPSCSLREGSMPPRCSSARPPPALAPLCVHFLRGTSAHCDCFQPLCINLRL